MLVLLRSIRRIFITLQENIIIDYLSELFI